MLTLEQIQRTIATGPFAASWDSLEAYTIPTWYQDAKFGIFIHWGVYSVPAFGNEWYAREMYLKGTSIFEHHVATYGPQDKFGYKDFIPLFQAERYDPQAWAHLFKEAGARFVVPVAEHHDGFQMYASQLSRWNAAQMGPKRDLIGDLAQAVRAAGMTFGVSSHRAEHWFFLEGGRQFNSDVNDPAYADFYGPAQPKRDNYIHGGPDQAYLEEWLLRSCELIDLYQPQIFWFDWWIMHLAFKPYLKQVAAYYYNRAAQWNQGVAINHKFDAFPTGVAVYDIERGQLSDTRWLFWQTDSALSKGSWGYVEGQDYKDVGTVIGDLIDIVSKNGALLLNIGPKADGTIPEPEQQMLRTIGQWLQVNGEAIYDTRPWTVFGEGPTQIAEGAFTDTQRSAFTSEDLRFTQKGDTLYAILLAWPSEKAVIQSLGAAKGLWTKPIHQIQLLGHTGPLTWQVTDQALIIDLPAQPPCDYAYTLKIG
ncbi:MAG: alpha-L-fucosidase [Caldilineaceae bacterium]|nr:alpha-L-fucosidase [Caldilineaceae bacterium]